MSLCYDFEKWTMITLAAIAISLTVGLLLIKVGHGQESNTTQQTETEPRTLQSCVTQGLETLMLNPKIHIDDPAYKTYMINMCNFYHEKMGVFPDLMSDKFVPYLIQYGDEVWQKYGQGMPQEFKDLKH